MGSIKGVVTVFLFSQTAWMVLYVVSNFPFLTHPSILLPVGIIVLCLVVIILHSLLKHKQHNVKSAAGSHGMLYYTSCMFAWSCVIDGIAYLEANGIVQGFFQFYFEKGEPYLATSFGTMANFWDITIQYFNYLTIIYCLDNDLDVRNIVLFWSGSLSTILFCLVVGATCGSFGSTMYMCSWLNIPYVVTPIFFFLHFTNTPRHSMTDYLVNKKPSFHHRCLRVITTSGACLVIALGIVRGCGALDSPFPLAKFYADSVEPYIIHPDFFGSVWVLFMMFIGSYILIALLYGLHKAGAEWMLDWSIVFTGITVTGSFLQFAQFLPGVSLEYHPSMDMTALVVIANLLPPAVAISITTICHFEPGYFKKTVTSL